MLTQFDYIQAKTNKINSNPFLLDTINWFGRKKDGHMGKWQYCDPLNENDLARGSELWSKWAKADSSFYMLKSQAELIEKYSDSIVNLTGPAETIIDMGPGEQHAVNINTMPFVKKFKSNLKNYVPIDLCESYANDAAKIVKKFSPNTITFPHHQDFLKDRSYYPISANVVGLCLGGIVGNYEGAQNTRNSTPMLVNELKLLRKNFSSEGYFLVGLDANQDEKTLFESYDHPDHAAYEINVLFQIKRDLLHDQNGFMPEQWKYKMAWYPKNYQFCHIALALEDQNFTLNGNYFKIKKGEEFVVDNSFKFPTGVFQQAALMSGYDVKASFLDDSKKMALHLLKIVY